MSLKIYLKVFSSGLLANVHYMLSPVHLSSLCNVHAPYQPVEIFGNISTAFGTLKVTNAVEILPKMP